MSKIDHLIQQLCPNGVEWKTMGEIGNFIRGNGLQKKDFTDSGVGCIHYGQIYTYYGTFAYETKSFVSTETAKKLHKVDSGDLIITNTSENISDVCKTVAWLGKDQIVTGGHATIFKHNENPKYLAYYTQSTSFYDEKVKYAHGTKVIEVSVRHLSTIPIPVPPLVIQEEIVRILDTFTKLEAELEAELKARKAQYAYYRNRLLTPIEINGKWLLNGKDVEWKTLGEIAIFISKGTTPKAYSHTGISFIKTEAFDGPFINKNKLSYIDEITHLTVLKRSILEVNDILFTIAGATIGKCIIVDSDILPANTNQALAIIRLSNQVNNRYVFYMLRSERMVAYINQSIKGSAQPNLNLQQLNSFILPIPPMEEQERIVSILDKFDALVNDISVGIPAEIAARRKQYEYYREKLLHFK